MEKRHVVFGAVFVAVFGVGMLNVMSDGRFAHQISSELPNHAGEGNVSIEGVDTIEIEPGETKLRTVEIHNAKRISYGDPTMSSNISGVSFSMSLQPPPAGVEQSMPPNYVYDHQERTTEVKLNLTVDEEANSANLSYELKAKPGNIDSPETVRDIPMRIQ